MQQACFYANSVLLNIVLVDSCVLSHERQDECKHPQLEEPREVPLGIYTHQYEVELTHSVTVMISSVFLSLCPL